MSYRSGLIGLFLISFASGLAGDTIDRENEPRISARVGLSALTSLCERHLLRIADDLEQAAGTPTARSLDWQNIRKMLLDLSRRNISASAHWFSLPDGRYWTTERGLSSERLSDRAYFSNLFRGERVLGSLVASKSSGRSSAVVAVPIRSEEGAVVGALGASVDLEQLSLLLGRELGVDETMIYYSFDSKPILGLVWDPSLTLADPNELGSEVRLAFDRMRRHENGLETYAFRGRKRTVVFRRSPLTGWWFAFGVLE